MKERQPKCCLQKSGSANFNEFRTPISKEKQTIAGRTLYGHAEFLSVSQA